MQDSWDEPTQTLGIHSGVGWDKEGCTLHIQFQGSLLTSRILNKGEMGGKLCKNNQERGNYGKAITSE